MKDTCRRVTLHALYDQSRTEAYLTRMAAKGWLARRRTALGWTFRRCAPQALCFAVRYAPAQAATRRPAIEADFTPDGTWQPLLSYAQLRVYCTAAAHPAALPADAGQEQAALRELRGEYLPGHVLFLAFLLRFLLPFLHAGSDPSSQMQAVLTACLALLCAERILGCCLWRKSRFLARRRVALEGVLLAAPAVWLLLRGLLRGAFVRTAVSMLSLCLYFLPAALACLLRTLLRDVLRQRPWPARMARWLGLLATLLCFLLFILGEFAVLLFFLRIRYWP